MANADQAGAGWCNVEVAYATPPQQTVITLRVPAGTTLGQAIIASGITQRHAELDAGSLVAGVFGEVAERGRVLREGERVEIYRPLLADPKQARRRRAAAKNARKAPGSG